MRRIVPNSTARMPLHTRRYVGQTLASNRRGLEYLELLLVLPILVIATIAIFEFGILMVLQATITSAAVEGAREYAKPGATPNNVADYIHNYLAIQKINFNTTTTTAGTGDAYVRFEISDTMTTTTTERGNTDLAVTAVGPPTFYPNEVRVTICTRLVSADGHHPVPNWLKYIGLDISKRQMRITSSTLVE